MTSHADLSDPIRSADEPATTGEAPGTEDLPDFLTVVEAARLLRVGRTSAYLLAQRWLYSDGREGLPVVRVGRQLRVPRRALERLAGGELSSVPVPPEPRTVPVPSTTTPTGAPTDDAPPNAEARTRDRALTAKPRPRSHDARLTQPSLFPTDR